MRKLIFWIGASLDGYFEGPDADISWHKVDAEFHQYANDELAKMSAFLQGRKTHALMAAFWPRAAETHPGQKQMVEFGELWKRMSKFVYSRTWTDPAWNSTIYTKVDPAQVQALKSQPGGDMTLGGPELAAEFLKLGLVDEIRYFVHPVLVGKGKQVFPEGGPSREMELQETKRFGNGVVMLRYQVAGA